MIRLIIILIIFFTPAINLHAKNYKDRCDQENLGIYFYCKNDIAKSEEEEPKKESANSSQTLTRSELAKKLTQETREEYENLLNQAIHFGTEEDIKKLLEFNNKNLEKSSLFASNAKKIMWQDAKLSNQQLAVSGIAKKVWTQELYKEQKDSIKNLNDRYGVFFLYRSDCPYCKIYSPILKEFAREHELEVMAVSLDGEILEEWPNTKLDAGQSKFLKVNSVPATILFDKKTQDLINVGFGVLSHSDLLKRINILIKES